ncbi:MAG TPA: hypothetical protein VKF79_04430 [Candidatus Acidoferrum sp.]|nr:hypothetical protein [Candidatus Acidoferrum sp.]
MVDQAIAPTKKSSPALILLAWVVVSIPASWGIYNTGLNAMKLFTETSTSISGKPIPAPAK